MSKQLGGRTPADPDQAAAVRRELEAALAEREPALALVLAELAEVNR